MDEIRAGRSLSTFHVAIRQDDGPPSILGHLHMSTPWEGMTFSDLRPPALVPPENAVRLAFPGDGGHVHHLATLLHPDTTMFADGPQARWLAWTRRRRPTWWTTRG